MHHPVDPQRRSGARQVLTATAGRRAAFGRGALLVASLGLAAALALQALHATGATAAGFATWRPVLLAYVIWTVALCFNRVATRGAAGRRALFVLPAALFTLAVTVFPTLFGVYIAGLSWNLSSVSPPRFVGFANLVALLHDTYYWNALANMGFYAAAVLGEYAVAFGLALILSAEIRGRRFFRIAFLLPFMLSPVAVSWMIGKSLMEYRFGPAATLARDLGWSDPAFFASPWLARLSIEAMDAWVSIPFMMMFMLAGLQTLPRDVFEAAKVDGAGPWQTFWRITFPLMLPVSLTALLIRIIFKLKLADLVINVTSGGPGGATDTVSSYIYRVYRDRSDVGYGTALAIAYLVLIVIVLTVLLRLANRFTGRLATATRG
jgi:multiple sugar transport system permease protein